MSLPYVHPEFTVRRVDDYIEFDHSNFNILFDGDFKLKMRICDVNSCGLCNIPKYSRISHTKFMVSDGRC